MKELAAALNNDANFATTVTNQIGLKLNKTEAASTYALLSQLPGKLDVTTAADVYAPLQDPLFSGAVMIKDAVVNNTLSQLLMENNVFQMQYSQVVYDVPSGSFLANVFPVISFSNTTCASSLPFSCPNLKVYGTELSVLLNDKSNNTNSTLVNATLTGTTTFNGNVNGLTAAMVNLGNVANTAPSGLPISSLTQSALNLKAPIDMPYFTTSVSVRDSSVSSSVANWYMSNNKVTLEHQYFNTIPVMTQALTYSNTQLSILIPTVLSQSTTCLSNVNFSGPVTFSSTVNGLTAATVGLANVANTAPTELPINTLTQTALNLKAPLDSPNFTTIVSVRDSSVSTSKANWYMSNNKITLEHQHFSTIPVITQVLTYSNT